NRPRDRGVTMQAVNLLAREDRRRGGPNMPPELAATAIGGFTGVMAALALLFVSAHGTVNSRRLELEQKKQELAAIPVPAQNQLAQQDALVADKKARVTALNAALARRVAWDRVLREFAMVLPDDVWLLSLSARSEEHTSELQSRGHLVCRLLLEKKNNTRQ